MLILCLYFQKLFCNTNNYEHVSKCSSRDTVRKFNPSTSSLCLQYSNDDIYSSAQMFVYILTFHVNKPIFLSLVNKISDANGTVQNANGKQLLSRFSGGWGVRSNFPPKLVTRGGSIYHLRQGCISSVEFL